MKILAVDDDPIILELLTEVLRVVGFTNLTLATSAQNALELIEQANVPFDCFLLDIQMPEMDGIELTAALRQMPKYAKAPILMITAMAERAYIDSAFAAGASDYITKPFEIGEVHARLRLIETLVLERNQMEDRNPVSPQADPVAIVTEADLERRLSLPSIDGFIDYLALENYLMQVSRISLFGMSVFGVVVPDMTRAFQASTLYEFESGVTDFAEAISDCLKPQQFFAAHAGGGEFVCVLTSGSHFDPEAFEETLHDTLEQMDLHFCDGRPITLKPVVGPAIALQMKSSRGVANTLVRALSEAEATARNPRAAQESGHLSPLKLLFGL
jgi:CheY-like chemotaxis protein